MLLKKYRNVDRFMFSGILLTLIFFSACLQTQELLLVDNGEPRAQIVIAEDPARMTLLAAEELQRYIEKISGARLPITPKTNEQVSFNVFVGRSAYTDAIGVNDDGLDYGAFHMIADRERLVLLGRDTDFVPIEPYTFHRGSMRRETVEEWDELTGHAWGNPVGLAAAQRFTGDIPAGTDDLAWEGDRRGSLYAVHEFLRTLGVRWYMPGELGEVVPEKSTIKIPEMDELVRPDYDLRSMNFARWRQAPVEDVLWYLRLGLNFDHQFGPITGHGLNNVTGRKEVKENHPEYFALWGGERSTDRGFQCLSSEGLFEETVDYVRTMFDVYDVEMVNIMPSDAFGMCRCELCEDKETPERGNRGEQSDYVWDFVKRVAEELLETHPDKKVICFAYGRYTLPPLEIDELPPNVKVGLVHGRCKRFPDRPFMYDARGLDKSLAEVREAWKEKTSNQFFLWEHYVFTHRSTIWPVYFPRAIARGLNALKGISRGEFIEPASTGHVRWALHAPGFNHLNLYVTARLYWDAGQDVEELLEEYCRLFYGPAAEKMSELIEYSEENWRQMHNNVQKVDRFFEIFEAAKEKTSPDTRYRKRIDALGEYLEGEAALMDGEGLRQWRSRQDD